MLSNQDTILQYYAYAYEVDMGRQLQEGLPTVEKALQQVGGHRRHEPCVI